MLLFLKRLKRAFHLQLKSIMVWPVVSVLQRETLEVTLGCYLQFWRECLQCILIISIAYKLTTGLFFSIHLNNSNANLVYDLQWFFCPLIFVTQVKNCTCRNQELTTWSVPSVIAELRFGTISRRISALQNLYATSREELMNGSLYRTPTRQICKPVNRKF